MNLFEKLKHLFNRQTRPDDPYADRVFVPRINAGMNVTHDTAMQLSAVYRAISYISSQIAMMPWRVMVETQGRKEINSTHSVDRILHRQPNPEMTSFSFREMLIGHALSWGNGYAEIEKDNSGRPVALYPISPDRVEVDRADDGQIVYEISNSRDGTTVLPADKVFHLHGPGFDGLVGYSVITLAARAIGLGMAAEQFGASFFQNGTIASGVLSHPGTLSEGAVENLRKSWNEMYRGPGQAHKPMVLEEEMKWTQISIPPEDAQFLQTRQFQVDDIARWYGLPPHKLQSMEKATFSNIEHQSIEVVVDSLQPWATRLEQEADRKLFNQRAKYYSKINLNSLLRGDVETRGKYYREMWNLGVLSVNEIRELEDMNPVPDGDKRFVQMNMTTLEKAGEDAGATIMDDYGIAVRSGAFTPQTQDEAYFREQAGLPPMSPDTQGAWETDGGVRRPVTLQSNEAFEAEQEKLSETGTTKEEVQMHVVFEACSRIARRERHRAIDAAKRYESSRDDFIVWMNTFFEQHEQYAMDALENAGVDAPYLDVYIPLSRLCMLSWFDDRIDYPVDEMAQRLTDQFVKKVA